MAARVEQDAKRRDEKKPAPVGEKAGLSSSDVVAILHELRAPLNAIVGFADLMQQETFGPLGSPKYNDYTRDIKQSGEYLLGVISDALELSRLESGRFQIQKTDFEFSDAVDATVAEQELFVWKEKWGVSGLPQAILGLKLLGLGQILGFGPEFKQAVNLSPHLPSPAEAGEEALWDKAVESLGHSAGVLEELAESTGEAIARIAARGDRIDRIQKETRELLNTLVASEADA